MSKCLQVIDYYERIKEASLEGIRQAVGEEKAAKIESQGFEALHEIITMESSFVPGTIYHLIWKMALVLANLCLH